MTCAKCGSEEVIPDVIVQNSMGTEGRKPLELVLYREPRNAIFKGAVRSPLAAVVCGACGYTELYATKHKELLRGHHTREKNTARA